MPNIDSHGEYLGTDSALGVSEVNPLISSHAAQLPSKVQRRVACVQVIALCWCLFILGWNDASIGPLLPRIRKVYDVDYQAVSWIFVLTSGGMVLGALINILLGDRAGFGKMLIIGSLLQSWAYMVQTYVPSFSIFVLSFFLASVGRTIQDIQANTFIALVKHDGETKMAAIQAAYGFGALFGPLLATQFSQIRHWSLHYAVSFFLSMCNMIALGVIFRFKGQDECLHDTGEIIPPHARTPLLDDRDKYSQILRSKAIHLLALFLVLYIGVGLTIGGWIVTFMVDARGGGPDSGYIAVAFSGGLALGRIILLPVTRWVGEVNAIFPYTVLAVFSQTLTWLVPSILLDFLAVFAIGIFLGPMYPILMRHPAKVVPRPLVAGSIGWIAACSSAGSAVLPFMTGWMAQKWGIVSLQPFLVVMMLVMSFVWLMVPKTATPLPRVS